MTSRRSCGSCEPALARSGYRVVTAEDAAAALTIVKAEKPDVVVLDLGLPDRSGFEVIAEIRKHSPVPIIVLSARADERAKVEALDLGADDYVAKPFGMAELMARIRAALRHAFQAQGELPVFISGDLTVDLVRRHVARGGQEIKLSPKEFDLLRMLVSHAGKVLTHRQLLREVWGPAQAEEVQYLRVFIRGLAAKARTRSDPPDPYPDRTRGRLPAAIAAGTACPRAVGRESRSAGRQLGPDKADNQRRPEHRPQDLGKPRGREVDFGNDRVLCEIQLQCPLRGDELLFRFSPIRKHDLVPLASITPIGGRERIKVRSGLLMADIRTV